MVDHKNAVPEDTEIEDIELSEELSELDAATPVESDDEEEELLEDYLDTIFLLREKYSI